MALTKPLGEQRMDFMPIRLHIATQIMTGLASSAWARRDQFAEVEIPAQDIDAKGALSAADALLEAYEGSPVVAPPQGIEEALQAVRERLREEMNKAWPGREDWSNIVLTAVEEALLSDNPPERSLIPSTEDRTEELAAEVGDKNLTEMLLQSSIVEKLSKGTYPLESTPRERAYIELNWSWFRQQRDQYS